MHRRTALTGIAGLTIGSVGVATLSHPSKGAIAEIDGLTIPDVEQTVNAPVAALPITVRGTYGWDSNVLPSRVVLRLEGTRTAEFTQLAATTPGEITSKEQSEDFELTGRLIQRLPELGHGDVNPQERGETEKLTLDIRIQVSVHKNGKTLQTASDMETVTISITKQSATAKINVSASGDIQVQTES